MAAHLLEEIKGQVRTPQLLTQQGFETYSDQRMGPRSPRLETEMEVDIRVAQEVYNKLNFELKKIVPFDNQLRDQLRDQLKDQLEDQLKKQQIAAAAAAAAAPAASAAAAAAPAASTMFKPDAMKEARDRLWSLSSKVTHGIINPNECKEFLRIVETVYPKNQEPRLPSLIQSQLTLIKEQLATPPAASAAAAADPAAARPLLVTTPAEQMKQDLINEARSCDEILNQKEDPTPVQLEQLESFKSKVADRIGTSNHIYLNKKLAEVTTFLERQVVSPQVDPKGKLEM